MYKLNINVGYNLRNCLFSVLALRSLFSRTFTYSETVQESKKFQAFPNLLPNYGISTSLEKKTLSPIKFDFSIKKSLWK